MKEILGQPNTTQINILMKEKQTYHYRGQRCGCREGGGWERNGLGFQDQEIQAITYRLDKQQGSNIYHGELYPMIKHNKKNMEKNIKISVNIKIL